MNEYFASAADVRRALGDLAEGADLMATADGREKSAAASRARLARMIGHEAEDAPDAAWEALAAWFAEAQIRDITDAAYLRLSRGDVLRTAPVSLVCRRLNYRFSLRMASLNDGYPCIATLTAGAYYIVAQVTDPLGVTSLVTSSVAVCGFEHHIRQIVGLGITDRTAIRPVFDHYAMAPLIA